MLPASVSYTHLDVYKRQVFFFTDERTLQLPENELVAELKKAVSYTHLDVYKRQRHTPKRR